MVGATSCLDQEVHAFPVADAIPISCPCVEIFHVDPRDNVEQRVRQKQSDESYGRGTAWWPVAELYGSLHRCQAPRRQDTPRTTESTLQSFRPNEVASKIGRVLETHHFGGDRAVQEITISSGLCGRSDTRSTSRGGRVFLTFPWNWNVLTTWPIQSVLDEAPFLFAREGKRCILTNCVDTARLVGRSRCCKSLMSQRLVQSSLANMFVSHEVYLWNVSIQEDSVYSCYPLDDDEATAFPSEADEAMREWRQKFPEQTRRAIIRIHTNLGHPLNSTLAKMITDAGGSEEMIKCANRYPCSVCKRMPRPRLRRPVSVPRTRQFNDTLLADVHFWNYQGSEVLAYSLIDEATRFHVTQVVPSQSARDLYEAIMNAWVKWARAPRFLLLDPHRSHLARQFIEQLGAQGTTVLVGAAEASWTRGLVWNVMEQMCDPWWRKWFTMECLMT